MSDTTQAGQKCDWCEIPFKQHEERELLTVNECPFMVHEWCAAAVAGVFVTRGNPIDIIDLRGSPESN
jgi:hypothetical protein